MCNVTGENRFVSTLTGQGHEVVAKRAVVDAAYCTFEVPSTHPPKYSIAPGVRCIPPNELPHAAKSGDNYVIVGAGKTAMDVCLWLLDRGTNPERIRWIIPRDAWFLNRANIQPGDEFFLQSFGSQARQFEAVGAAKSISDLFERLEAKEDLLRLDPNVRPTAYRCAVMSKDELVQLRQVKNVVRLGYVKAIQRDKISLDRGQLPLTRDDLIINCSASGISRKPLIPIWADKRISIQFVRTCQPLFSAAFIGFIEATFDDEALKNTLCAPVPLPVKETDWLTMLAVSMKNRTVWRQYPQIENWLAQSRLNGFFALAARVQPEETEKMAVLKLFQETATAAASNLPQLLETLG